MNTSFDPNNPNTPPQQSTMQQLLTVIGAIVFLALAFMFSMLIFVTVAVLGLGFWIYLWWKTRALRQSMREQMARERSSDEIAEGFERSYEGKMQDDAQGDVIDGEAVRVDERP